MLLEVARELDQWVIAENLERRAEGLLLIRPFEIKVVGQTALLEQATRLTLAATVDVDVVASYEHVVEQEFRRLLEGRGRQLDPVGHEVWMPGDTLYRALYTGDYATLRVAELEAVLVSKALKAPLKNRTLITEYLAQGASERFLALAQQHAVDLEQFL
jgi:hypothetical protein